MTQAPSLNDIKGQKLERTGSSNEGEREEEEEELAGRGGAGSDERTMERLSCKAPGGLDRIRKSNKVFGPALASNVGSRASRLSHVLV